MALVLTRQNMPTLDRTNFPRPKTRAEAVTSWPTYRAATRNHLIGTGREYLVVVAAYRGEKTPTGICRPGRLHAEFEVFDNSRTEYREQVLPTIEYGRVAVKVRHTARMGRVHRRQRRASSACRTLRRLGAGERDNGKVQISP